jgi:hypothetical protein
VTEQKWLEWEDPEKMLEFLRVKVSDRKLRLFAVACCRRIEKLWGRNVSHQAILTAEQYADGLITAEELETARNLVQSQLELHPGEPYDSSYWACCMDMLHDSDMSARNAALTSALLLDHNADHFDTLCEQIRAEEKAAQCNLLRDIIGYPYRPIALAPACRTPEVLLLARSLYEERRFEDMPVLADALEEAGCQDAAVLGHCRGPGPHVRGCWVLDLLLGKE